MPQLGKGPAADDGCGLPQPLKLSTLILMNWALFSSQWTSPVYCLCRLAPQPKRNALTSRGRSLQQSLFRQDAQSSSVQCLSLQLSPFDAGQALQLTPILSSSSANNQDLYWRSANIEARICTLPTYFFKNFGFIVAQVAGSLPLLMGLFIFILLCFFMAGDCHWDLTHATHVLDGSCRGGMA